MPNPDHITTFQVGQRPMQICSDAWGNCVIGSLTDFIGKVKGKPNPHITTINRVEEMKGGHHE